MEEAPHVWVDAAAGPTCSRCKLVRGNGRSVETAGKVCPVMACKRMGLPWPEGEASLAKEMGKLHGFRRWCETPLIEVRTARPAAEGSNPSAASTSGSGPPAEALFRPVRLHLACKLGRRWLCLNCCGVEEGGVAAFRRARCAGIAPIAEAHRALFNAVVRYGPSAGLTGAAQVRPSALWAAAGCQASVFTLALPPERPVEPLRTSVIGRALLCGLGGSVRNPKRGPGEAGSHPLGLSRLGTAMGDEVAGTLKRRRSCVSSEASQPDSQCGLGVLAACREVGPGPPGPLLSSAVGRALLRGHAGLLSSQEEGPGGAACHSEAPSRLVSAAGAEGRRLLKRRRSGNGPVGSQSCSQGALDALAACSGVEVASAIAAWPQRSAAQGGAGGGSSSGPSGHC